ncbi:MAG: ferrochelatase, partial [Acidimicrobiales bacterium]
LSPLAERTRSQAAGVQAALDAIDPTEFQVFTASKHAKPFLEDGVRAVAGAGITELVAMVLAPHYSSLSVGEYLERVEETATGLGMTVHPVRSWHLEPGLVELLASRLEDALRSTGVPAADTLVLVTAHSLPRRVLDMGDPYPDQLLETAEAVTAAAGVSRWQVGWQSAGRTPEPWLGPDVLESIETAAAEGAGAVVVCPAGFTSDHLEVLYDLDIQARAEADRLGVAFARTASLNDDPDFCHTVAGVAARASGRL